MMALLSLSSSLAQATWQLLASGPTSWARSPVLGSTSVRPTTGSWRHRSTDDGSPQSADHVGGITGFQEGIEEGKFGAPGRGIERAVAGGMHSLVIDEAGKVRPVIFSVCGCHTPPAVS